MTYFQNCQTLEEVKKLFKTLAKQLHPDHGGSTEAMQKLNAEYSFACATLAKGQNLSQEETDHIILDAEAYKNALNAIINLPGIVIELVGNWLWVSGNTYPVKNTLKGAGFLFASAKKMWFFRTEEYKVNTHGKSQSMDEIKAKYGSQTINGKSNFLYV